MERELPQWAQAAPGGRSKFAFVLTSLRRLHRDRPASSIHVLDVGCGGGDFAIALGGLGYRVTGIDMFESRISSARAACSLPSVSFHVADADTFAPDTRFDAVLCLEVIEHLSQPVALLTKIRNLLDDSGLLVVTIPNGFSLLEITLRVKNAIKRTAFGKKLLAAKRMLFPVSGEALALQHAGDIHCQHFTHRDFASLLRSCGFETLDLRKASALFALFAPLGLMSPTSRRFLQFDEHDSRLSQRLPLCLAGGWYYCCAVSHEPMREVGS